MGISGEFGAFERVLRPSSWVPVLIQWSFIIWFFFFVCSLCPAPSFKIVCHFLLLCLCTCLRFTVF